MTQLESNALGRDVLGKILVEDIYAVATTMPIQKSVSMRVCESHERLRMELEGVNILRKDDAEELRSVLTMLDSVEFVGQDGELMFVAARERLRKMATA